MNKKDIKIALVDTLPVLTGYIVLGMGFGILMGQEGYGAIWSFCMGLFVYAGSMQYLAVDLMGSGASLLAVGMTTLMVNARHLFYGISMIDTYKQMGKAKPYMIFALTDETYSLVCKQPPESVQNPKFYLFFVSLFNQIYWVSGCLLGGVVGQLIPFDVTGIDFALTALFVTVFTEQWLSTKNHSPAITGVIASVICLFIFGQGGFLIPAMLAIATVLTLLKPRQKEVGAHE